MYIVRTYLGRSEIEGVGVFAGEDISKGTTVSRHVPGFDMTFAADYLDTEPLDPKVHSFLERHSYINGGKLWVPGDLDMFTNHADTPNVGYRTEDGTF